MPDDNVVNMDDCRVSHETIWCCGECDSITFHLHADGMVECAECCTLSVNVMCAFVESMNDA